MVLGKLDLGSYNPFKIPANRGVHVGTVVIPGGYAFPYGDHSDPDSWTASIWIKAPNSVGQFAAGSQAACEMLSRQVEELARNPDQQPVYVQFYAGTGTIALSPNFNQPQDGFYYLTKVKIDYTKSQFGYTVAGLDLQYVSPGPPRTIGISRAGAALSTGFTGAATDWVAYPLNATIALADATRTGAEGAIQLNVAPALNPAPYVPSVTISDNYKCGASCWDVMAGIGTNAVPLAGLFTNANWIEVFGKDHRFTGDVILTNGLILWSLALTASPGIVGYVWIGGQWQQFGTLAYNDQAGTASTLRQVTLQRVSLEEVRADLWLSTSGGQWGKVSLRLQRGAYFTRLEFTPMSQSGSSSFSLKLTDTSAGIMKAVFNSGALVDESMSPSTSFAVTTDYGYAAGLIPDVNFSGLFGLLWQSATNNQPAVGGNSFLGTGDLSGPTQNATKMYGLFAFPFATPQNLQAEAEGGTLAGGTVAVNDSGKTASPSDAGNNAAKIPNTTVVGATGTFGTAWQPPAGQYKVWFRIRCTTATNATANFKWGLYNSTDSVYVQSATSAANAFTTAYAFYSPGAPIAVPTGKNVRFRFENTGTSADDFFIDEAYLAPITSTTSYNFPQDQFQQFAQDRTTRIRLG